MTLPELLERIASLVISVSRPHPVRVAIDGVDGAGKTTLADRLAGVIEARGRSVIRASIDGFHRPRAERLRRGEFSPESYYLDSFDYDALLAAFLVPLGPGGNRIYRRTVFDYRTDSPVTAPQQEAAPDAVALFDGVFLLRPELNHHWDCRVFLEVSFAEVLRRVKERDPYLFGSETRIIDRYQRRYIPGQQIYLEAVRPEELADVIVDNNDVGDPKLSIPNT